MNRIMEAALSTTVEIKRDYYSSFKGERKVISTTVEIKRDYYSGNALDTAMLYLQQ